MASLESLFEDLFEKIWIYHIPTDLLHIRVVGQRKLHHGGTWLTHHILLKTRNIVKSIGRSLQCLDINWISFK